MKRSIFETGYDDYFEGVAFKDNPYPPTNKAWYELWEWGWLKAEIEDRMEKQ